MTRTEKMISRSRNFFEHFRFKEQIGNMFHNNSFEPVNFEPSNQVTDTIFGEFIKRNPKLKRVASGPNVLTPSLFSL